MNPYGMFLHLLLESVTEALGVKAIDTVFGTKELLDNKLSY